MSLQNRVVIILVAMLALAIPLDRGAVSHEEEMNKRLQQELSYYQQASVLSDLLFREGVPVNMKVVVTMLREIDKNIIVFYPKGPFTRTDFIALGWLESEYRQYERGTHGERGIFQIMPGEFRDFDIRKNYYNVDINTQMAFRVMDGKFQKHKDYKLAIMAYNGLVKTKNGKYSLKYWKSFEKRKVAVELVLNNISHDNP